MKKSSKSLILIGAAAIAIGMSGAVPLTKKIDDTEKKSLKAYNYKPDNILDNVFMENNNKILPFIYSNKDQTVTEETVRSEFKKANLTIKNISTKKIATGTTITVNENSDVYTVLIYGDTNNDGKVNLSDAQRVIAHYFSENKDLLQNIYKIAGNVVNDTDKINLTDAQRIIQFYLGNLTVDLVLNKPMSDAEDYITDIQITSMPKTQYQVGESLDLSGGEITITHVSGKIETKPMAECEVTGFSSTAGNKTITVTYGKNALGQPVTITFNVTVSGGSTGPVDPPERDYTTGITISAPTQISYIEGTEITRESLKDLGLCIKEIRNTSSPRDINITSDKLILTIGPSKEEQTLELPQNANIANLVIKAAYTTTDAQEEGKETQFEAYYNINVKKQVYEITATPDNTEGYRYDNFKIEIVPSTSDQAPVTENDTLTWEIVKDDIDISTNTDLVKVSREIDQQTGKVIINVMPKDTGKYFITPTVNGKATVADPVELKVIDNPTVNKIILGELENKEKFRIEQTRIVPIAFKHTYIITNDDGEKEELDVNIDVAANRVLINGKKASEGATLEGVTKLNPIEVSGIEATLLNGTNEASKEEYIDRISLNAITEGEKDLTITVDNTKEVEGGKLQFTVLPKATTQINIVEGIENNTITLYTKMPQGTHPLVKPGKDEEGTDLVYSLIKINITDSDGKDIKYTTQDIVNTKTDGKVCIIDDISTSTWNYTDIKKYKYKEGSTTEIEEIPESDTTSEVAYIGIAIYPDDDKTPNSITIHYDSAQSKKITVVMPPEEISTLKANIVENNAQYRYDTFCIDVDSGDNQQPIQLADLEWKITKDGNDTDISSNTDLVKVTKQGFDTARNVRINFIPKDKGTYYITPKVGSIELKTPIRVTVRDNATVSKVIIGEIENKDKFRIEQTRKISIGFKHTYTITNDDGEKETIDVNIDVIASRIAINGEKASEGVTSEGVTKLNPIEISGIKATLVNGTTEASKEESIDNIVLRAVTEGDKNLTITVDNSENGVKGELQFTVLPKATTQINIVEGIENNTITLYTKMPQGTHPLVKPGKDEEGTDLVYSLIKINITDSDGKDIKYTTQDIVNTKTDGKVCIIDDISTSTWNYTDIKKYKYKEGSTTEIEEIPESDTTSEVAYIGIAVYPEDDQRPTTMTISYEQITIQLTLVVN